MKVSTKGRYGLRVMIELALRHGQGPVMMDTIARCTAVSRKYLYNLLTGLKTAGLVRATRGAGGGFELTREPATINVEQVIRVLEGPLDLVDCTAGDAACDRQQHCVARGVWIEMGRALQQVMAGLDLQQLADRQRAKTEEPPMYYI